MLSDATYREWTKPFCPDSSFEGTWEQGSKILFLGSNPETGEKGGMVSRVAESRLYEFVSLEHLGMIKNGVEDMESEEVKKWAGAHENYTFNEKDGGTELLIDMDVNDSERAFMEAAWQKALEVLKELVEKA